MHYITALTESEFLYVFKCKDMLLFKPDFWMGQKFGCMMGWGRKKLMASRKILQASTKDARICGKLSGRIEAR
jgi:hypothetical protein